nr:cellulose synthase-like protein H1 [Ipomoea batatas]
MTNAPFMLNVDCDFYVNDPKVVLHALCFLLGAEDERDVGFVQFPQTFIGGLKDDPYGNQLKVIMKGNQLTRTDGKRLANQNLSLYQPLKFYLDLCILRFLYSRIPLRLLRKLQVVAMNLGLLGAKRLGGCMEAQQKIC